MTEMPTKSYSINPVHDVLYVTLSGTWSPENTLEFVSQYKKEVSRYFAREWASVFYLNDLEMLLAEDFQIETFKALFTWSYIKGMQAMSLIVGADNRSHLLYQFEEMLQGRQPFATKVCHGNLEAGQWLRSNGFQAKYLLDAKQSA